MAALKTRHIPRGVCATEIEIESEDRIIKSVRFKGGCAGNAEGISRLVEGMNIDEAISRLKGIRCGRKPTSCPDQLAQALEKLVGKT